MGLKVLAHLEVELCVVYRFGVNAVAEETTS